MQYITNETYNLVGREVKIVEELSKSLKFHAKFQLNVGGILYENGTATGSIGDLLNKNVDFIIADYSLKLLRLKSWKLPVPTTVHKLDSCFHPDHSFLSWKICIDH